MKHEPKITADPATWPIQNISVSGSGPTDGEILDWQEENEIVPVYLFDSAGVSINFAGKTFIGPTLRAAIQNAMKEGTK